MKREDEPVAPEERVLRLIWHEFFDPSLDLPVQPVAFAPRKNEVDGISVFRLDCLSGAEDALTVIVEEKRSKYAIVAVSVSEIITLGLTVKPFPISQLPGHAVIPELNIVNLKADKNRWKAVQQKLAAIANRHVLYRPTHA